MTSKQLQRPPYVLAHPADVSGCGFRRIMQPVETLTKHAMCSARMDIRYMPEHILAAMQPDVVVWQRQNADGQIAQMKAYRAALPNAFFVYEIDDVLSSIPEKSWHAPFMPPGVDERMAQAIALCDVVTVTTAELAAHMKTVAPKSTIRIVPNMLTQADIDQVAAVKAQLPARVAGKLRVGWGGGISHDGDLALLEPAMAALTDEVEWIFIGAQPAHRPEGMQYRFVPGTSPEQYISALAALDVDLIVAPLEDNLFNRCKSNLRLLEAGICGYPAIATPLAPYCEGRPPVYGYAETGDDWISLIRKFAALSIEGRQIHATALQKWVHRRYIMDNHLVERMKAWLPDETRLFMPKKDAPSFGVKIARDGATLRLLCVETNFDVVYVRPGVEIEDVEAQFFAAACAVPANTAGGSVVSNDGGPAGFPVVNSFAAVPAENAAKIKALARDNKGIARIAVAAGPVLLLRRAALALIGPPDFDLWPSEEAAILEWSLAAAARGFHNVVDLATYVPVATPMDTPQEVIARLSLRLSARWPVAQTEDAKLASFRASMELRFQRDNYQLMPPQNHGDYSAWVRACDMMGPRTAEACLEWFNAQERPQFDIVFYTDEPLTIEQLRATHSDWKVFLPEGAIPAMPMLAAIADAIDNNPEAKALYADHDYVVNGVRQAHDFKPHFDMHMLLGRDYVSQVLVLRADVLEDWLFGETRALPAECQLYEKILELAVEARDFSTRRAWIAHIPRILAHLPQPDMARLTERVALKTEIVNRYAASERWTLKARPHPELGIFGDVSYLPPLYQPKVTVIIPTKDKVDVLGPCLATVLRMTRYTNFEVLVIDNGSTRPDMLAYLGIDNPTMQDERVRVLRWDEPFNWAKLNNFAVQNITDSDCFADSDYYCFLNDDTRVLAPDWLDEMVGAAQFPGVGVVGAKLTFPHGPIQHIGVVRSAAHAGHMQIGLPGNYPGYNGLAVVSHEATAVTGACMLVSRTVFEVLGGFDENLPNNYNDVAFCLAAARRGLTSVVATRAHLQHMAGASRASDTAMPVGGSMQDAGAYLAERWPEPDPYWNDNLLYITSPDGGQSAGLSMDTFRWPPPAYPWQSGSFERVLVLGPTTLLSNEIKDRAAIYRMVAQGNAIQIVEPPLSNVPPFDLRDPDTAMAAIQLLGIDRIIITALENGSLSALAFMARLGVPVVYRPQTAESACPRRDLRVGDSMCAQGWKHGACQTCIDINGSPNGYVSLSAWRSEWERFFKRPNVTAQLDFLDMVEYSTAIGDVYASETAAVSAA